VCPAPWVRVAALFDQTVGLTPGEREGAIRAGSRGDRGVEDEVRGLMRAAEECGGGDFIRDIVARAAADLERVRAPTPPRSGPP
jgi:hypothetical protein